MRNNRLKPCALTEIGNNALVKDHDELSVMAARTDALRRAESHSPFLGRLISSHPDWAQSFINEGPEAAFQLGFAEAARAETLGARLRRQRQAVACVTALADLSGDWDFHAVTRRLSDFADAALGDAIAAAIEERAPGAGPAGFAAIALGKHGSRELNYSSDIDPILLFDPETIPCKPREEPVEAAVRIGRRVLDLLQTRDEHGYVFRVDLRLRPSPEATPIVLPVDAAISYYESAALPWERAAFIRARAAAGDHALGERFLAAIQPFIWRRSLDYNALREVQSISLRIRDHHRKGQNFGPGWDMKRGRGGIREIEFHAQILQMIYGGREPDLRAPATLDALSALAGGMRMEPHVAAELASAYRVFRTIEHRLQMVDDRQTHSLPADPAALDGVAALDGLKDGAALLDLLRPHAERVGTYYDKLAGEEEDDDRLPATEAALDEWLVRRGFEEPEHVRTRITAWRSGQLRALRSEAALRSFENLLPLLISASAGSSDPSRAIASLDRFLEQLPSGVQFFGLLEANPRLVELLGHVLAFAPVLAEALARRPALIEGLIDATAFDPVPSVAVLAEEFRAIATRGDYEAVLEAVRTRVDERRFALGVQLVERIADPLEIAGGLARLAEAALTVLTDATISEFEKAHGRVEGGRLIILGLGRFGGGVLTPASDLDVVFLFSGRFDADSDGQKPLGATVYFNRLAQRVVAAMSQPTLFGPFYDVDTRLRPSGAQGLLAVSIDSFARYQAESAWTWEHMALTRARVVYGMDADRAAVDAVIDATLHQPRDVDTLTADVIKMRAEMNAHKPAGGPLDVKLAAGGLVDLEFVVHYHQLRHRTGFTPNLGEAVAALAEAGLVDKRLSGAHDLLTRMLIGRRLLAPDARDGDSLSPHIRERFALICGFERWDDCDRALGAARELVSREWMAIQALGERA